MVGRLARRIVVALAILVAWTGWVREAVAVTTPVAPGFNVELLARSNSPSRTYAPAATAMTFAPNGNLLVAFQNGSIQLIRPGQSPATFGSVATSGIGPGGENGLLGIAVDPDYATNRYIYLHHTLADQSANRITRVTANAAGDAMLAGSATPIFTLSPGVSGFHNGGGMHFGPDGKLYIGSGERGTSTNSQSLTNTHGKMLRINADGSIPSDNPFYGQTTGEARAIWARGLRNPYTFAFHAGDGRMFINDVGQGAWEEINVGVTGANYGWSLVEGPSASPGFTGPLYAYPHGTATNFQGVAITGGDFYDVADAALGEQYRDAYFFADYQRGWINYLDTRNGNAVANFGTGFFAAVDLTVGPDGALYTLGYENLPFNSGGDWYVWRVSAVPEPAGGTLAAFAAVLIVRRRRPGTAPRRGRAGARVAVGTKSHISP